MELEQSRSVLEKEGVRVAAVSYDSQEKLRRFGEQQQIGFPLLSDRDSAVIRAFGIFNTNIAPDLRSYGVPHPVDYLVSPDGAVIRKYFVPNYQHRVTASDIALRQFGAVDKGAPAVRLERGAVSVEIGFASGRAFAGQEVGFYATFTIEPGWHIYGTASVTFDDPRITNQSFELDEGLQLYSGSVRGIGALLLKYPLDAGPTRFAGELRFQQCSETVCEAPEALRFELPLTLAPFLMRT